MRGRCFLWLGCLKILKMKIYVISGGPGTGKTSVINELGKEFKILPEAARFLGENDKRFKGKSAEETDKKEFQDAVFEAQKKQIETLKDDKIVFSDRGIGDTIAYYKINGMNVPKEVSDYSRKFRYSGIFIMNSLNFYEKDDFRQETEEKQKKIHEQIIATYKKLGYKIIFVPFMSVEDRVRFIKERVF